jgi:hypothetical protein
MKIDDGGTPIYVHSRDDGAVVMQGSSYIKLSSREISLLIRALGDEKAAR